MSTELSLTFYDLPKNRQWRKLLTFYQRGYLCDVELLVGNDKVTAHKIVLCSASKYFQTMFHADFAEKEKNLVDFTSVFSHIQTLRNVLGYIYQGDICLTSDTVMEVLDISTQFILPELKEHCSQFLLERLQPRNAIQTWHVAHLYDLRELEEVSQTVAQATFCRTFIFSNSISLLKATFLAFFLHDRHLNLNSIDRIELVLLWLCYDIPVRLGDAKKLVTDYIRQNPLPSTYNLEGTDTFDHIEPSLKRKLVKHFSPLISEQKRCLEIEAGTSSDDDKFHWCLMVQEERNDRAAFYCGLTNTWFSTTIFWEPGEIKGFVNPHYLVHITAKTDVCFVDLTNSSRKPISNIFRALYKKNATIEEDNFDFFCHSGNLYILITVFAGINRKPEFNVYMYDTLSDVWNYHMEVNYEYFGDDMSPGDKASVTLKVHVDRCNAYLLATISTRRKFKSTLDNVDSHINHAEFRFQDLKNFHVISFNVATKQYITCGVRWQEPTSIQKMPLIILKDRICFLKFANRKILAEKFRTTFVSREECYMDGLCLIPEEQSWEKVTIGLPSPNLPVLPIKNPTAFFETQVINAFDKLFVGVKRAPYVYQIAMYNLNSFSANILPYTSLPVTSIPQLSVFYCPGSISTWVKDTSNQMDDGNYHFTDYTINSWRGSKVPHT